MNEGKSWRMRSLPSSGGRAAAFALAALAAATMAMPAAAQRVSETPVPVSGSQRDWRLEDCAQALGRIFAPSRAETPTRPVDAATQTWLRGLAPSASSGAGEAAPADVGCLTFGLGIVNRDVGGTIGLGTLPGLPGNEPLFVSHGGRLWGGGARFGMNHAGEDAAFAWTGFYSRARGRAASVEAAGGAPVAYTFGRDAFGSTGLFLGATGAEARSEVAYSQYGVAADFMMSDIAALRHMYGADVGPDGDERSRWAFGASVLWTRSTLDHSGVFQSLTFPDIRADVDRTLTSDAFGLGPKVTFNHVIGDGWSIALGADMQLVWRDSTLSSRETIDCGGCGGLPPRFDIDVFDDRSGFDWAAGLDAGLIYRQSPGLTLAFGVGMDAGGRDTIGVRANPAEPATGIRRETTVDWSLFASALLRY